MKYIKDFHDFLNLYRVVKVDGVQQIYTHTSLGYPMGSYNIPVEFKSDFFRLYRRAYKAGGELFITEKHKPQGPIVIDVDIKYNIKLDEIEKRKYTEKHIKQVIQTYNYFIKEFLQIDDIDKYQAYVFEKEAPTTTIDIDKINCKDGFHIIYPFICTKPILQHILRACIIDDFNKNKYFDDINPTNNLDDIFDKAVIERNGWMMYGSNKPNCFKYKLTNVYDNNINIINLDDDDLIELIQTVSIHKFNNEEITKYNSNFDDNKIETMFEKIYPKYSKKGLKGTEDEIRIAHILINLLKVERVNQYNTWIEIGFCLHNIDDSLLDLWIDFSKQCSKYKDGECQKCWNGFRDDGLTIRSLHRWASDDNPEGYGNFMYNELSDILKRSISGTSYDIAKAFYENNKYNYVVSSIQHKIWYYFDGSKWKEMECAYKIINQLNEDMVNIYLKMASSYAMRASAVSGDEKDQLLKYQASCVKLSLQLRQSAFKKTIIEELLTLYYDPFFMNKLDEYRHLLCFNNGVMDMNNMLFRQGRPEDYISLSTNIDYIEYDEHNKYVQDVEQFFTDIQPEDNMRDYLLRFLSSCIAGFTPDEKIHIWTGSGSNGKSLVINLLMLTLGDYTTTLSISLLTQKRAASNAATPELADTKGKRFAVFQEPNNNDEINVGYMKELTGNDKIKARKLYKEPIEFYPQFKPVLTCNKLPIIPSHDGGTWRRIRVTPFQAKFVENPKESNERKINKKLKETLPLWKEAFMSILINTYKTYKIEGIVEPDKVLEFTKRYELESDQFQEFISIVIDKGTDTEFIDTQDIYHEYQHWFKHNKTGKCNVSKNDIKYELEDKFKKSCINEKLYGYKTVATITGDGKISKFE